jgi:hypothetical protein
MESGACHFMRIHVRDVQSVGRNVAHAITHQSEFFADSAYTRNAMRIVRRE